MENMQFGGGENQNQNQNQFLPPNNNPVPAQENYPQPVADNSQSEGNNSALHFFMYLVSFLSLSFVAMGLGTILYQIINKIIPDTTSSYADLFEQGAIKFGLASIIIATPVYFILSFFITKFLFQGSILENSKVRKWITYIILFFAAAVILGDLISLVYNWLGGDIAGRFILKVFVVLLIAGSIFGYYFWDMRKKNIAGTKYLGNKVAAGSSLAVISIIFIISFFIIDSPATARNKTIDEAIINSMQSYEDSMNSYYQKNNSLPESLLDLNSSSYGYVSKDNKNEITYKKTGQYAYQLCANFKTSNLMSDKSDSYYLESYAEEWKHDKGSKCFDKEINQADRQLNDANHSTNIPPAVPSSEDINAVYEKSLIKSMISATRVSAMSCSSDGGTINSGKGGELICNGALVSGGVTAWPMVSSCGSKQEDSKWTVFNGDNDKWTITLTCTNNTSCNGSNNAICNKDTCTFQGTCQ